MSNQADKSSDFSASGELAKDLGLKEALTIGVGTMIGAGIFVLPRFAIEMVGPGAIFTYILAGLICIVTASSIAEVATGMPKSGGTYFFLSRSLGNFVGTISGLSLWLSLTFAVAFYLLGFGEYLAIFIPVNETILAIMAGIFFTYINYIGAKETGRTQNIIVGILVPILIIYIIWGFINIDRALWQPFFPEGTGAVLPATAVIFVSFLGFEQIASVAEEIKEPGKNLPKAIMGSVAIVTAIYVPVILVMTGVIPLGDLIILDTPVVDVARVLAGGLGAAAITFAALLATASSANASIMASSRINFAMGRDSIFPDWFNKVHPDYLTPYRPIIATGLLALIMLVTADVEALSASASVLMLINYAVINLIVILLRTAPPEEYNPSYRAFGYPFLQILAAAASLIVIFQASSFAQIAALVLIALGVIWFLVWARSHADLKAAISDVSFEMLLRKKEPAPAKEVNPELPKGQQPAKERGVRTLPDNMHVLAPLANPEGESALLSLSGQLVKNSPAGGEITALNMLEIPSQAPLNLIQQEGEVMEKARDIQRRIMNVAVEFGEKHNILINPRVLYSRNKFNTLMDLLERERIDYLQLGWHGSMNISKLARSFVNRVVRNASCPVGVLKYKGLKKIDRILVPYRGSEHAYLGAEIAFRLAAEKGQQVTVLRVIKPGADAEKDKESAYKELKPVIDEDVNYEIKAVEADSVADGIVNITRSVDYDLVIIGASKEWRFKNLLFGSIPDLVAEEAGCSVLMVRQHGTEIELSETDMEISMEEKEDSPAKL